MLIQGEAILVRPSTFLPSSPEMEVIGTTNPAAVRLPDGTIALYVRVIEKLKKTHDARFCYSPRLEGTTDYRLVIDRFPRTRLDSVNSLDCVFLDGTKRLFFISHLRRVILDPTGFSIISMDSRPSFYGLAHDGELGIEDARISVINGLYYMTYVALSRVTNVATNLAVSRDALHWDRKGVLFREQNKDVVLFPGRIREEYAALNRPEGNFEFTPPGIWISYSPDLTYWGRDDRMVLSHYHSWDAGRIGAGPPPVHIPEGWLMFYHGVTEKPYVYKDTLSRWYDALRGVSKTSIQYLVGVALLDEHNPSKVRAKSTGPLLVPHAFHDEGTFEDKKVIFPTGLVLDRDSNYLLLFSGGGDTVSTVKRLSIDAVRASLMYY